jgi:hypothetical protein
MNNFKSIKIIATDKMNNETPNAPESLNFLKSKFFMVMCFILYLQNYTRAGEMMVRGQLEKN